MIPVRSFEGARRYSEHLESWSGALEERQYSTETFASLARSLADIACFNGESGCGGDPSLGVTTPQTHVPERPVVEEAYEETRWRDPDETTENPPQRTAFLAVLPVASGLATCLAVQREDCPEESLLP